MTQISWRSHAPGSLMLLGEHAVLHQQPAIACAINTWLHIDWQTRTDDQIIIHSQLGEHHTNWQDLTHHPKLSFALACLASAKLASTNGLPGLSIRIHSDINSTQGLGSSSAVVAAMLVGLAKLIPSWQDTKQTFAIGLQVIRQVQGTGSGTDLAAALTGGIMHFDPTTQQRHRLCDQLPLVSLYCGYKTPTPQVIAMVEQRWHVFPALFQQWLVWQNELVTQAMSALKKNDLPLLGQCFNLAHGMLNGLGVSDITLEQIALSLRQTKGIYGAKISGSGLGDCVIGLGTPETPITDALAITTTHQAAYISE